MALLSLYKSNSKKTKNKWIKKVDKKYIWNWLKNVFKPTFWLEKLMKLICNKLRNEDQHMF